MGHQLIPLADELTGHLEALGAEPINEEAFDLLKDLAEMDPYGMSFRYAERYDAESERNGYHVDFPSLADALKRMTDLLGMTMNSLEEVADYHAELASCADD